MPVTCTLNGLASSAKDFTALSFAESLAIQTYQIAVFAGIGLVPATLLRTARAFLEVDDAQLLAMATQSICAYRAVASGFDCSIQNVETNSESFTPITRAEMLADELWLWTVINTSSTVPATLLASAKAFMPLSHHEHLALQCYLLCTAIPLGPTCTPAARAITAKDYMKLSDDQQNAARLWLLCQIGTGFNVPIAPTGFTFTLNGAQTVVTAAWDATPAGVTSTEVWTSTDNVTFALERTVAAPGTSTTNLTVPTAINQNKYAKIRWVNGAGNGPFTSVLSVTFNAVSDWSARIVAAGGAAPSAGTQTAVDTWWTGLSQSIKNQIIALNFFAPDNLTAACTPFIKGPGNAVWTNNNFVGGDLSVSGLQGNGTTKFLDTGLTLANIAAQVGSNKLGIQIGALSAAFRGAYNVGTYDGTNPSVVFINTSQIGSMEFDYWGAAGSTVRPDPGQNLTGLFMGERYSLSTQTNMTYTPTSFAPLTYTFYSTPVNNVAASETLTVLHIYAFALNNNGVTQAWWPDKMNWISFSTGFSAADAQTFAIAARTLRDALGGSWN